MSWTDPCRGGCGGTRADCFCKELDIWLTEVKREQSNYKLFKGVEINRNQLIELWKQSKSPIEALNDLSTIA